MKLFNRCKHQWEEQGRKVMPPRREVSEFRFEGGLWGNGAERALEMTEDAVYGCTFVHLRCSECGDVRWRKLRGA